MELVDVLRNAAVDVIARNQGLSGKDPKLTVAQKGITGSEAVLLGFPVDLSRQIRLQVTTPGADFGRFIYMPDYDDPGGGGIIR